MAGVALKRATGFAVLDADGESRTKAERIIEVVDSIGAEDVSLDVQSLFAQLKRIRQQITGEGKLRAIGKDCLSCWLDSHDWFGNSFHLQAPDLSP